MKMRELIGNQLNTDSVASQLMPVLLYCGLGAAVRLKREEHGLAILDTSEQIRFTLNLPVVRRLDANSVLYNSPCARARLQVCQGLFSQRNCSPEYHEASACHQGLQTGLSLLIELCVTPVCLFRTSYLVYAWFYRVSAFKMTREILQLKPN